MTGNWAYERYEQRKDVADQQEELERETANDPLNMAREEELFEVREERKERKRQRRSSRAAEEKRWWARLRKHFGRQSD